MHCFFSFNARLLTGSNHTLFNQAYFFLGWLDSINLLPNREELLSRIILCHQIWKTSNKFISECSMSANQCGPCCSNIFTQYQQANPLLPNTVCTPTTLQHQVAIYCLIQYISFCLISSFFLRFMSLVVFSLP